MKFNVHKENQYSIIEIQEENLNSLLSPDLKSLLTVYKGEGVNNMILDFKEVKYIDSSGLSAVLTGHRLWSEAGNFILCHVLSDSVKKIISISQLENILVIFPTLQEAIDYVIMDEIENQLKAE